LISLVSTITASMVRPTGCDFLNGCQSIVPSTTSAAISTCTAMAPAKARSRAKISELEYMGRSLHPESDPACAKRSSAGYSSGRPADPAFCSSTSAA
jgi:hypothetical protein